MMPLLYWEWYVPVSCFDDAVLFIRSLTLYDSNFVHLWQGVGTKFLQESVLRQEEGTTEIASTNIFYGRRIRDCHAEVLARRAFRRTITLEMQRQLKSTSSPSEQQSPSSSPSDVLTMMKNQDDGRIVFGLKDNITLHFYASSAPCGNATVRQCCVLFC